MIEHIQAIYFSPTGGTKKYVRAFASRYPDAHITEIDITTSSQEVILDADMIILGSPVYEGAIPEIAVNRFLKLTGHNIPTVCLISYGQVEFGAALYQFEQIAKSMGLSPCYSIAAPAHHSFATDKAPLAFGRPDERDLQQIRTCSLSGGTTPSKAVLMSYLMPKNSARRLTKVPKVDKATCISCGLCAKACPVGAISSIDYSIDRKDCLRCFACVNVCPTSARAIEYRLSPIVTRFLNQHNRHRASVEVFTTMELDRKDTRDIRGF